MYDSSKTYYVEDGSETYYTYLGSTWVANWSGWKEIYAPVTVTTYTKATKTINVGNFINSYVHHSTFYSSDFEVDDGTGRELANQATPYVISFTVEPKTASVTCLKG